MTSQHGVFFLFEVVTYLEFHEMNSSSRVPKMAAVGQEFCKLLIYQLEEVEHERQSFSGILTLFTLNF